MTRRGRHDDDPGRARGSSSDFLLAATRAGAPKPGRLSTGEADVADGELSASDRHAIAAERQAIATERATTLTVSQRAGGTAAASAAASS